MLLCLAGTDPEDVIRNAFACFDEEGTGKINEDRLRELLTTMGDRFNDAEVCMYRLHLLSKGKMASAVEADTAQHLSVVVHWVQSQDVLCASGIGNLWRIINLT